MVNPWEAEWIYFISVVLWALAYAKLIRDKTYEPREVPLHGGKIVNHEGTTLMDAIVDLQEACRKSRVSHGVYEMIYKRMEDVEKVTRRARAKVCRAEKFQLKL